MISRRSFNAVLTGLVAGGRGSVWPDVVLEAEFAARVPAVLEIESRVARVVVWGWDGAGVAMSGDAARMSACGTSLFELRAYRSGSARLGGCLERIFPRVGIHPLLRGNLTYLIPFENLTAREQAWNALNADPEWVPVRHEVDSYQFGLYRASA